MDQTPLSDQCLFFCLNIVPPEITANRSTSDKEPTGAEKWTVGERCWERKKEGERGHRKGKIKEKVVKRCV